MAKVPVILNFGDSGAQREVASLTYSFHQAIDCDGQVTDYPKGGLIVMRLKALNKPDNEIIDWMLGVDVVKNGEILFYQDGNKMKSIEFQDAYCINYVEHWEDRIDDIDLAHWEEITLSCRIMNLNGSEITNQWEKLVEVKKKGQDVGSSNESTRNMA